MSGFVGCKYKLLAVVAGLTVIFAACGEKNEDPIEAEETESEVESDSTADSGASTGSDSVVIIEGEPFTCDQVIGGTCGPETQAVFDRHKDNLDDFVNKPGLGPYFNESTYEDVAFAGLAACTFYYDGEDAYIDFMLSDDSFKGLERITFLPVWFEAPRSLCPMGPRTQGGSVITP